jgi:phospholipid-binding lipoprotein MlaA
MPSLTLLALSPPLLSAALAAAEPAPAPAAPAPEVTPLAWSLAAAQDGAPPPPPESVPPATDDPAAEPPVGEIVVEGSYGPPATDPAEAFNAESYRITQAIDQAFVEPLAYAYRDGLPGPIRDGLSNAVRNLGEPSNALNFLLQGKVGKAVGTLGRLAINSTLGLGGLIDIAGKPGIGLPYRRNGFANTMGYYGVGPGPYLYLPVTGATSARDVIGSTLDQLLLPIAVGKPFNTYEFAVPYFVINGLDARLDVDAELTAIRATDDPYGVRRDTYLARREREIAALKGEAAATPEADKAEPAGDPPLQSNLSLPERLQVTAGATPAGR